jgi:glycosyltransferase involved in cell wall biosynthesis
MHILIVGLGGVTRTFRHWPERVLACALVRRGHTVHAIGTFDPQRPALATRHEIIDGVDVSRVRPGYWPNRELAQVLKRMPRPDIVHLMHPRNVLAAQTTAWAQQHNIPTVYTWLGPFHDEYATPDRERPYEVVPTYERLAFTPRILLRLLLLERNPRDVLRNYRLHWPLHGATALLPCSTFEATMMRRYGLQQPQEVVPLWIDEPFIRQTPVQPPSFLQTPTLADHPDQPISPDRANVPTLQHSNAPTLQRNAPTQRSNATLQHSNAPTLQRNAPTQRSNAPTLQRSNAPTLQRSNAPTLQRSNAPTRPWLLFVGQLTTRKGYDLAIQALPSIVATYPTASLLIVSGINHAQRTNVLNLAREAGVEQHIVFLGYLSDEDLINLYRSSDALLFPTRFEGFGLPLLEAMAADCPVITTNIPVVNEIVQHNENGILVPYGNAEALAQATIRLLQDPELREQLIAGGRTTLREHYHEDQLVRKIEAMYHRVQWMRRTT